MGKVLGVLGGLSYLVLVLLGGCALTPATPAEIREQGVKTEFKSAKSSIEAADCIARVIEEYRPFLDLRYLPRVRQTGQGSIEVHAVFVDAVFVIAEVRPSTTGADIVLWRSPQLIWPLDTAIAKSGC